MESTVLFVIKNTMKHDNFCPCPEIQWNYEHMQKQKRTNKILITDYVLSFVAVVNIILSMCLFKEMINTCEKL